MFVLAFLDRDDAGRGRVVQFGPTSKDAGALWRYESQEPICLVRTVLRTLPGGLLRVSQKSIDMALQAAA